MCGVDPEVGRLSLHVQFSEWTHWYELFSLKCCFVGRCYSCTVCSSQRRSKEVNTCTFILLWFKAVHGMAPDYVCELISRKIPAICELRSNQKLLLRVLSGKMLPTLGARAFFLCCSLSLEQLT